MDVLLLVGDHTIANNVWQPSSRLGHCIPIWHNDLHSCTMKRAFTVEDDGFAHASSSDAGLRHAPSFLKRAFTVENDGFAHASSSDAGLRHVPSFEDDGVVVSRLDELPRGPQSLLNVFRWPDQQLKIAEMKGLCANILQRFLAGLDTESDFSGIMMHNLSLHALEAAARRRNLSGPDALRHIRATECEDFLRRAILSHVLHMRPEHVHLNVLHRASPITLDFLQNALKDAMVQYENKMFHSSRSHAEVVSELGMPLLRRMLRILKEAGLVKSTTCSVRGHRSCPHGGGRRSRRLRLRMGGLPCQSHSTRGKMFDLLHANTMTLAIIIWNLVEDPVDFGLYECTARFDALALLDNEDLIALYFMQVLHPCQSDMGHPSKRRRLVVVLVRKETNVIQLSLEEFYAAASTSVELTGDTMLCAPQDAITRAKAEYARRRRLPASMSWFELLPPTEQNRVQRHREMLIERDGEAMGLRDPNAGPRP